MDMETYSYEVMTNIDRDENQREEKKVKKGLKEANIQIII